MRWEGIQERANALPSGFDGSLGGLAEQSFELGEELLDRIEIGTVGRQEEQFGADCADGTSNGLSLVASEIVDNDDVAGLERRYQ